MKTKNPFLTYGYISPEFFCDREEETATLISALENGRNITLVSSRRMGKTGLIHNAFHRIGREMPEVKCFYLDIFHTTSLREFTLLLAKTVIGQLDSFSETMLGRLTSFFKSCRPVVSVDSMTGAPSVTLDFVPDNAEQTLGEIFEYMKQSGKECVVAIDEFQQITEYPEKGAEALIRSHIQFLPNVSFIFSGSKHHIMLDMFMSPKRPFYQSTQKMHIGSIDERKYHRFAACHLAKRGITMDEGTFHYLYTALFGHTWYIQRLLNKIFEICEGNVSEQDINECVRIIISEEEFNFHQQFSMLTLNQRKLLTAIAKEGTVEGINGKDFMQRHSLGAPSSINRALESLLKNEFVIDNGNSYQVYDRFMGIWLRKQSV